MPRDHCVPCSVEEARATARLRQPHAPFSGGDNNTFYPLDPSAKRRLFKAGDVGVRGGMSRPNGGNFANSLATGFPAAKRGERARRSTSTTPTVATSWRTRAQMDANTRLEQAKAAVLTARMGRLTMQVPAVRRHGPQGAKALRDAMRLHGRRSRTSTASFYVRKTAGCAADAAAASPAPSVLNAAVEQQESGQSRSPCLRLRARPMQTMPGTLRDPGWRSPRAE